MSLRALVWAFDVIKGGKVSRDSSKLVLLKLADRANDDGTCWPGRERLGSDLGLSEPTVRQGTRELERLEVVKIERRKDTAGRDLSNVYHLPIEGEGKDSYPRGKQSNSGGSNACPESVIHESLSKDLSLSARASRDAGEEMVSLLCRHNWNNRDETRLRDLVNAFGEDAFTTVAIQLAAVNGGLPFLSDVAKVLGPLRTKKSTTPPHRRDAAARRGAAKRRPQDRQLPAAGEYGDGGAL